MKSILLAFLVLINCAAVAQIVNIPDTNFKAALVAHTTPVIDTNGDGEIQVSEAENTDQLFVAASAIADITGIEAFTNITTLVCGDNYINNLDLSSNTSLVLLDARINFLDEVNLTANELLTNIIINDNFLTELDLTQNPNLELLQCRSNFLTSLDLSQNEELITLSGSFNDITSLILGNKPELTQITFGGNALTSIDLSQCPALGALTVHFSDLTELDTSNNPLLRVLRCYGNQLTNLDFSTNTNLQALYCYLNPLEELNLKNGANSTLFEVEANMNPELGCIEVDDEVMANAGEGVYADWLKDETTVYAEDCSLGVEDFTAGSVIVSPNPFVENFRITSEIFVNEITIYNQLGQAVRYLRVNAFQKELNLAELNSGLYFLKISAEGGENMVQLIKH